MWTPLFRPLGHPAHHNFLLWKPKATNTSAQVQVQALIAGVEAEEVPPEEDGPDADFAGAPLLAGGDEDEWETWCTEHLQPLNDAGVTTLGKV